MKRELEDYEFNSISIQKRKASFVQQHLEHMQLPSNYVDK